MIGYSPWDANLPIAQAYDPKNDAGFGHVGFAAAGIRGNVHRLPAGRNPRPGLAVDGLQSGVEVLKIVLKCRWEE